MSSNAQWSIPNLDALAYRLVQWRLQNPKSPVCVVVADGHAMRSFADSLACFCADMAASCLLLPDWETLAYDHLNAHKALSAQRLRTLYYLQQQPSAILVCTLRAAMCLLPPKQFVTQQSLLLATGDLLSPQNFRASMLDKGYMETMAVREIGDFCIRGSILDVYSSITQRAYRIELFDDEIESIRWLDPKTQLSSTEIDRIDILPTHEYRLDSQCLQAMPQRIEQCLNGPATSTLIKGLTKGQTFAGLEYYLALCHPELASLSDYFTRPPCWLIAGDISTQLHNQWLHIQQRFQTAKANLNRQVLPPEYIFQSPEQLNTILENHPKISYSIVSAPDSVLQPLPPVYLQHEATDSCQALRQLQQTPYRLCFFTPDQDRVSNLSAVLSAHGFILQSNTPSPCSLSQQHRALISQIMVLPGLLQHGFIDQQHQIAYLSESDLMLRQPSDNEQPSAAVTNTAPLAQINSWEPGMYLVHRDYGIGKYLHFVSEQGNEQINEFVVLEYAKEAKLYVALSELHLLTCYQSTISTHISLDQLGSKRWQQKRQKAERACEDLAAKLLQQHAFKQISKAPVCAVEQPAYQRFIEAFAFTTTPDQQRCIDDVLADMASTQAMDRLVCGDVGFGKTEVALRAAFVAINSGYQVAIMAPTTLLVSQHFRTFSARLANFAFRLCTLSRLSSSRQCIENIESLASGGMDLVIATHKLLSPQIKFKRLGLLIIDEEHRFGVKQKEMLQALRSQAHTLSLSATPIPRSLHMAMSQLRQLSIIATPPKNRYSIQTFVHEYSDDLLKEAILRERQRGGQVYYMHNDVHRLARIQERIHSLIPGLTSAIVHGKLAKNEIEQIMLRFANQQFDLLICTTIIESGIDIPNANTIILHRADLLGLSQIHQLRGRVGRSFHQAYAYLFTAAESLLTADAKSRLDSISRHRELGAGMNLALEDLEIRGAGDLLGAKQSGHIYDLGLELYAQMLQQASQQLQQASATDLKVTTHRYTELDCGQNIQIPASYIQDTVTRLNYYRKIQNCINQAQLQALLVEFEDRFGLTPKEVHQSLQLRRIQQRLASQGIQQCRIRSKNCTFTMFADIKLDPNVTMKKARAQKCSLRFLPPAKIQLTTLENITMAEYLQKVLDITQ